MAFEDIALPAAWAVLFVVLAAVLLQLLPGRAAAEHEPGLPREDDFPDLAGPIIDAEPA